MATQRDERLVPQFDLADRMRKALRSSGLGVQEIADYLDVSRNTVSTWINGRITPSTQTLRLWALRCEVPFEWLRDGDSRDLISSVEDKIIAHRNRYNPDYHSQLQHPDITFRDMDTTTAIVSTEAA